MSDHRDNETTALSAAISLKVFHYLLDMQRNYTQEDICMHANKVRETFVTKNQRPTIRGLPEIKNIQNTPTFRTVNCHILQHNFITRVQCHQDLLVKTTKGKRTLKSKIAIN